jgi:uncharacterized protein (TIGR04255 family)
MLLSRTPHPTYPRPTIVQVLCEIAFTSAEEVKLRAAELYPVFSSEFPEIQPVQTTLQFKLVMGQGIPAPDAPPNPNASALRFTTGDGKRFVQISPTNFVYQSSDRYLGWEKFKEALLALWSASTATTKPITITKVGLRYVNRIIKSKKYRAPGDWLKPTADLPAALLASKEHFLARIESSPLPSHLRLLTLANEPPGPDWPLGAILWDLDRLSTGAFAAQDKQILKTLELLHEDVWKSFDSAATDNLKRFLSGRLR